MRQSVINYVKENGIKLAANSKALKLINNGASEAEVAVALQTTKAYKEDSTLRQMCQEVVAEAGKEQADSAKKPENHSNSARRGENERYQFHSIQMWQESCITALASSPMAWEAFKMKQRNKKLLWQYINRIWPYKLIAGTKVNKNKKDLLAIAKILKNLSSKIQSKNFN